MGRGILPSLDTIRRRFCYAPSFDRRAFLGKKQSWLLKPDEMAEDVFWMASGGLLWGPIISDLYRTPVSEGFLALRDMSPLQIEFQPSTVLGLISAMLVIRFTSSFFYYGCTAFSMSLCSGGECMRPITTLRR